MNTKNIIKDLKILGDIIDFSNLNESHELFSNKNKKMIDNFKIQNTKNNWIDRFVCLRRKRYSFKCGDESKNKLKRISKSQPKQIEFEEQKNCLFGKIYQEDSKNYVFRSINHGVHLQEKKSILSIFDDKRCYINETESIPWN